ncbi:hypothetical protein BCR34DRAFT_76085 [Clohesyomyces aquaticus]|uniref:Uncharacterized protein n=1 Tax=Clohesyomyces aquaticus TaxID=1231657 RepID=A0A1Y1YYN8_9PLEO|nr:hypothetical protein BCR34DRAFT_76085 [Clohesyomyces aquaticus]
MLLADADWADPKTMRQTGMRSGHGWHGLGWRHGERHGDREDTGRSRNAASAQCSGQPSSSQTLDAVESAPKRALRGVQWAEGSQHQPPDDCWPRPPARDGASHGMALQRRLLCSCCARGDSLQPVLGSAMAIDTRLEDGRRREERAAIFRREGVILSIRRVRAPYQSQTNVETRPSKDLAPKFSGRLLFLLQQPPSGSGFGVGQGPDREKTAEWRRPVRTAGDIQRVKHSSAASSEPFSGPQDDLSILMKPRALAGPGQHSRACSSSEPPAAHCSRDPADEPFCPLGQRQAHLLQAC